MLKFALNPTVTKKLPELQKTVFQSIQLGKDMEKKRKNMYGVHKYRNCKNMVDGYNRTRDEAQILPITSSYQKSYLYFKAKPPSRRNVQHNAVINLQDENKKNKFSI